MTTRLPCSDEAFACGKEEKAPLLQEVFEGAAYSTFASCAVTCHIFNQILKHIHVRKPGDRPEDIEYGGFWTRHREIDNQLSRIFMFLPSALRIPLNVKSPVAVQTTLNLHAAVICLHNSAVDICDEHDLPSHIKQSSVARLMLAAQEIVKTLKLTAGMWSSYVRVPLWSTLFPISPEGLHHVGPYDHYVGAILIAGTAKSYGSIVHLLCSIGLHLSRQVST